MQDISLEMLLSEERYVKQRSYWMQTLSAVSDYAILTDYIENKGISDGEPGKLEIKINASINERLNKISSNSDLGFYVVLLTALSVLLSRYSISKNIIIASPVYKKLKTDETLNRYIFINSHLEGRMSFKECLMKLKKTTIEAYENQDYPLERLYDSLPWIGKDNTILVGCILDNIHDVSDIKACEGMDITLRFKKVGETVNSYILFNKSLYGKEFIERLAEHYINVLESALCNLNSSISDLRMLSQEEVDRSLLEFNNTQMQYCTHKTVSRLFEEQVEKNPDSIAIVCSNQFLSYGEVNKKANQLANKLIECGVVSGSIVGIMTRRSLEMMIGIMGVLKAGAAYLPIDPEYPSDRINYIIKDSETNVLLFQKGLMNDYEFSGLMIDLNDDQIYQGSAGNPNNNCTSDDLAYVIYTSGSTGNPKGVMIKNRAVVNFIEGVAARIEFKPGKTILALTTICFDIFVLETLLPLSKGMKVIIAEEAETRDLKLLSELIIQNSIEMIQFTPSRLSMILNDNAAALSLKCVKQIMVGGETFPKRLLDQLRKQTNSRIYNMYGPTETTVWSSIKEVTQADRITIGEPIANTKIYILDENLNILPEGIPGELCIGGDGLAKGYLNRAELTSEKFLLSPFNSKDYIYKTGDLAMWLENGEIEFIGRIDNQVKIRGYRIELGEVEVQLVSHKDIIEAVVVAQENGENNLQLCAYVVSNKEVTAIDLRQYLARNLPDYMIPSYFVKIDKVPLTPNGKVDRLKLKQLQSFVKSGSDYKAPENEIEKKLVEIWSDLLNDSKENIGINDKFLDIGGNSLLLIQMHNKIVTQFGDKITLTDLFSYSTIKEIAGIISNQASHTTKNIELRAISIPHEFFTQSIVENDETVQSFKIQGMLYDRICHTAINKNLSVAEILVGAFVYLFYEVAIEEEITIQTAVHEHNLIKPLSVNFGDIDSIEDLLRYISMQNTKIDNSDNYRLEDLSGSIRRSDINTIIPFICCKELLPIGKKIPGVYDFTLQMSEETQEIGMTFEYNGDRLKKEKADVLISDYFKILETLIKNCRDS